MELRYTRGGQVAVITRERLQLTERNAAGRVFSFLGRLPEDVFERLRTRHRALLADGWQPEFNDLEDL